MHDLTVGVNFDYCLDGVPGWFSFWAVVSHA
jgi:hypothetical protein